MAKKESKPKITQRRNGRWAVTQKGGEPINGAQKVEILTAAGKLKASAKKKEPAAVEETSGE